MKTLFSALVALCFVLPAMGQQQEKEAIKEAIVKTYAHPLYEGGSLDDIRNGLHEGFEMYVYLRGEFSKRSKAQWLERLETVRKRPKAANAKKHKNTYEFPLIDVTGQTAMVKLVVYRDGKLNFTDYLTLYRIDGEWKLLSKFFTYHGNQ